jgi:hypothetical protein
MAVARPYKATTWWNAPKDKVHDQVISYVRSVENFQSWFYLKCLRLEALVDQNPRTNRLSVGSLGHRSHNDGTGRGKSIVTDNLVRQGIDSVTANVADSDFSIRIQTDNADWTRQQNAKRLEQYANALMTHLGIVAKCQHGFRTGAALKGKAFNKVWIDQFDQLCVRPVPVENVVVDELECRDGRPLQLHYREFYDRELLAQEFPDFADEIGKAQTMGDWRKWAGYRPFAHANELVVIESWRLPLGPKGHPNYVPGRHTICIHNVDLLDEEYDDDFFPFASMDWERAVFGFYGHGLAEYILPHQTHLNRRNWQITTSLDKKANPIVWVHTADKNLSFKTFSQVGITAGAYKTAPPTSVDYQAVGQETYQDVDRIMASAARETGVNQMMVNGQVPGGIESGEGVREARITHSQRFSIQEHAYEQYVLDTVWLAIAMCKKLPKGAQPDLVHASKFGGARARTLKWGDINLDDLKYEMAVASAVSNTPAGRQQRVTELAQAGIISLDESRELIEHPDIDRVLSLYNAAIESVQWTIERIENGETGIVPEPFMNLGMCVTMMQREYLMIATQNAPEDILEALANFVSTAAQILNPPPPPSPPGMPIGAPPPMATPPGQVPVGGAPTSAMAAGAYNPMTA